MRKIAVVLIIMLWAVRVLGQPMTEAQVDDLVEKTMAQFEVPGIAVAILKDGEAVHMKGYGVRSLDSKKPMDRYTLFGIASNSKAFTAVALGILVDEKKLSWDDRVIDYIPEFRLYDPYVTNDFRIRDLLCHRSGMGLGAGDLMIWPDGTDFTRADVIHNLRYLKQVSPFRTKYDYDNLLYIVAGEVIRAVSGLSWEAFVEELIMRPLSMEKSAASFNRLKDKSNVIDPHGAVNGRVQVIDRTTNELMNAAGGIYSSIYEMSHWASFLLDTYKGGKAGVTVPISRNQIQELWSPQTIIPADFSGHYKTNFSAYGLGFRLNDEAGYKVVSHTGGLAGMVTKMTLVPELNLAIIVLTNQQSGAAFSTITNEIKDAYFGLEGMDWLQLYAGSAAGGAAKANAVVEKVWKQVDENRAAASVGKQPSQDILGTYKDPWLGEVKLYEKDGSIRFLAKRSPGLDGEVFWYTGNSYVVKWADRSMDADAFILFELDYEGRAVGFKMKAISPLTDFSYDFHDLDLMKIK